MICRLAATAAVVLLPLSGCDQVVDTPSPDVNAAQPQSEILTTEQLPATSAQAKPNLAPVTTVAATVPAAPGAPAFAVLFPGAQADSEPTVANGEAGKGGMITFQTEATPDMVVSFYQQRAEAAGMKSIMGMNQGDARAFGAADNHTNGASLQVVAAPGDDNLTSVQLSWTEGQ